MIRPACSIPASCGAGWGRFDAVGVMRLGRELGLSASKNICIVGAAQDAWRSASHQKTAAMETVVDRVPLESWRDRRTGGEG
jgi:hypothetical protein